MAHRLPRHAPAAPTSCSSGADFTWQGHDEMDEASGDGFAELDAHGSLSGEIRFHNGDESGFKACPWRLLQQPASFAVPLTLPSQRDAALPLPQGESGK